MGDKGKGKDAGRSKMKKKAKSPKSGLRPHEQRQRQAEQMSAK